MLLEKIKAAGFNTVSIYSNWAFHAPNNHTVDFETGARNIAIIFELAAEVGLFVTLRGGPYVNAETTAGGFALWTVNGAYGELRNDDPRYTAAWTPYFTRLNEIASKYQLGKAGTILLQQIENEFCCQRNSDGSLNTPLVDYMVSLQNNTRDNGVIVDLENKTFT
ncbi:hypothetical protein H0H93_010875, partial [Arthromyces matolae]